jgi:hypothetical protein
MAEPAPLTFGDIHEQAHQAAATALAKGLIPAARAAIATADRILAEVSRDPAAAAALAGAACKAGCSWCCHQVVGITAAEEELVLEAVKKLPAAARGRVRTRHAAAECPLLDDGLCAIHVDRPLPCRAVLSADAGACRSWHDGDEGARIPLVAVQRGVYSHAQAGLAQALGEAGMPPAPMALTETLSLAFG